MDQPVPRCDGPARAMLGEVWTVVDHWREKSGAERGRVGDRDGLGLLAPQRDLRVSLGFRRARLEEAVRGCLAPPDP